MTSHRTIYVTLTRTDNDNSEEVQLIFALNMLDLINADGC